MAGVRILGAPAMETPLNDIKDRKAAEWNASLRASDAFHALHADCRPLAQLLDEAEAADWLGEPDRDAFIVKVLDLPVQRIDLALEGLLWFDLTKPVPLEAAATRGAAAIMARAGPLAKWGGDRNGQEQGNDVTLIRGNSAPYLASRLRRDAPAIAAAVERGEYTSMRQAAIAAGIVKPPSGLAKLKAAWRKATEDERKAFLLSVNREMEGK